jgi:hypothetical protein
MPSILTFPALIGLAFAGGAGAQKGLVNAIPVASASPNASYADGFPILTMTNPTAGGVPPAGADFNGILNAITTFQCWANAGGQFPFNATLATAIGGYPIGAVLQLNGGLGCVVSTVSGNSYDPNGAAPFTNGWAPYCGAFPAGQVLVGSGTGTVGNASLTYAGGVLKSTDTTMSTTSGTTGALVLSGGIGVSTTVTDPGVGAYGISSNIVMATTGNNVNSVFGVRGSCTYNGANNLSSVTGIVGVVGNVLNNNSAGTVTVVCGVNSLATHSGTGITTNLYGIYSAVQKTAGTVTNAYGLYINPVTAGSTLNYAIYTNAGTCYFGGSVIAQNGLSVPGTAGLTLTFQNYNANASVACVFSTGVGCSGASLAIQGWVMIYANGANHYVPYW